jgi:hypothetical protein
MNLTVFGIRHHGVGSAQYVREGLAAFRPDLVLVEGPPELDAVLHHVDDTHLKPPVAILAYNPEKPQQAVYYPFAEFSPEWQAMQYARQNEVKLRMVDLPLSHTFGLAKQAITQIVAESEPTSAVELPEATEQEPATYSPQSRDPLGELARAAGYDDSELWWEQHIEQRYQPSHAEGHFTAVLDAFAALRETPRNQPNSDHDIENDRREAFMRQEIRQAHSDRFQNVVVVCGAWHAPALLEWENSKKADTEILKGLPKTPIRVTWIPWTYSRLGWFSGYGAGITSPGWYDHCWHHATDPDSHIRWLTHVARLFRKNKMDTSTAHIIEGYRLAEALASMRGLPQPGLAELNEATQTVLCFGDAVLLKLVDEELIVGRKMGAVPDDVPKLPLQADFEAIARKLRLAQTAERNELTLDLRSDNGLNRSRFLHRLVVLGVAWGKPVSANSKGTFKEVWMLRWEPEHVLQLIENGIWGNTVELAATNKLLDTANRADRIGTLAGLMQQAIPAELFGVIEQLLARIAELATLSADMLDLMAAFTPLVEVSRYGNVRQTDLTVLNQLVEGLITRVCIGLPNACYGLADDAAAQMIVQIRLVNEAVRLLENAALTESWPQTLRQILDKQTISPIITGCVCRLLYDGQQLDADETARQFGLALSTGQEPAYSAGWLDGFLGGTGATSFVLLHDDTLWNLLYAWVAALTPETFMELVPILRRTFSQFAPPERRKLGERAKTGPATTRTTTDTNGQTIDFNYARARQTLPGVRVLLGV